MSDICKKMPYWESEGRNPLIASIILLFLIGFLYFSFQQIVLAIIIIIDMIINKGQLPFYNENIKNIFDIYYKIYERYQYSILIVVFISQFLFFIGLNFYFFKKWHGLKIAEYYNFNKFNFIGIILSVVGIIIMIPFIDFLSNITFYFLPIFKQFSQSGSALFKSKSIYDFLLLILFIGVTPAICEEAFFRGYFQKTLQRKTAEPIPYIIGGIIFGLYHMQPLGLLALAAIGIYLGFVFYRFQSIYVNMACHFIYNSIILYLLNYDTLNKFLYNADGDSLPIPVIISFIGVLFIVFMIIIITKNKKFHSEFT